VDIDVALVRRLLIGQFPQWSALPLQQVDSAGWDNTIFRLGARLAVRLPRRQMGAWHVENEHRWLPVLAPRLPLATPVPLGKGMPAEGYPWHWTVSRWLPGKMAAVDPVADLSAAAETLAQFVAALQAIDPAAGPDSDFRSIPLAGRDQAVRAGIEALSGQPYQERVKAAWQAALNIPEWRGPRVWMHGDLHPANLLVNDGRLTAVIDFGLLAVGDPACDLMVGWTFLSGNAREAFRAALSVSDMTWARGWGWALDFGVMCAVSSADNPVVRSIGRHTVNEVLADYGVAWRD
jgi:aminoglycoside phosphotransferase (APT) family kinase protein